MRRTFFLCAVVFLLAVLVVSCGSAPTPTNPPPAATNTSRAPETLIVPSATLLATVTSAPSATSVPPTATTQATTAAPSASATSAPTNTPTFSPPLPPAPTQVSANKYQAPTPVSPLSKDVYLQRVSTTITFKWNPPAGVTALGTNECYKLDVESHFVNGPKFYSDYYVICDGTTEFVLNPKGGEGVPIWTTYVPSPAETMEMHWKVTVVLAGAQLDKPTHRQTTPLSPTSAEAVFMLQTLAP